MVKIDIADLMIGTNSQITGVNIYENTLGCNSLVLMDSVLLDTLKNYHIFSVVPGNSYVLKIFRNSNTLNENFEICIEQDNVICGDGVCVGQGNNNVKTPLLNLYQNCDVGLNYAVDYHTLTSRTTFGTNLNPQTFTISGIPPGAIIEAAYVWWTLAFAKENTITPPFGSIQINGSAVPGTILSFVGGNMGITNPTDGSLMSKGCWGNLGAIGYRADVLPFISASGNGSYLIQVIDILNGPLPPANIDADGATLMVIYRDPTANFTGTLTLSDGMITQSGLPAVNDNLLFPSVCQDVKNAKVISQFSDLQNVGAVNYKVDNINTPLVQNFWDYEENSYSYVPNQNSNLFEISSATDCYHWLLNGSYYQCSPDANIVSSNPNGYCKGGSPITLTASPFNPNNTYQWYQNGILIATGQQISVNPQTTTTYTLTVSSISCVNTVLTNSTSITVSILPTQTPQISGTNYLCNTQGYNYTVTNNSNFISYNWNCNLLPGGAVYSNFSGQGTASISLNPPFPSGYDILITVETTDANGCVTTSSFTAYKCCDAGINGTNITGGTYNNLQLLAGPPIAIQNNITLSGNCLFTNNDIRISPGVTITLLPGCVLTITGGAKLYSCSAMWQGIIVPSETSIIFTGGSVIEDAEAAITSINGGHVTMTNATLNRNYKGLVFEAYQNYHSAIIGNTARFFCANSTVAINNITAPTLDFPHLGENSKIGIEANDVLGLNIGVSIPAPAFWNVFDNQQVGIYLNNTDAIITCNRFQNIKGGIFHLCPNPPCGPFEGTAIFAKTKFLRNLTIGTASNRFNSFTDCTYGVYVWDYNFLTIDHNRFNTTSAGSIFSANGLRAIEVFETKPNLKVNMIVNIRDNRIKGYANGIIYNHTDFGNINNTDMQIHENKIQKMPWQDLQYGIRLTGITPALSAANNNWDVHENKINGANTGISVFNLDGPEVEVYQNDIQLNLGPAFSVRTGYRIENSTSVFFSENTINGQSNGAGQINHRGIWATNTSNCAFGCNTLNLLGQAMLFEGNNATYNNFSVVGNVMTSTYDGLVLRNSGFIGPQGDANVPSDNRFANSTSNSHTTTINSISTSSPLYVRSTFGSNIFTPTINFNISGGFNYNAFGALLNSNNSAPLFNCGPLFPPIQKPAQEKVANSTADYSIFEESTKWHSKYQLYKLKRRDANFASNNTVIDSFYVAQQSGTYEKFVDVYDLLNDSLLSNAQTANAVVNIANDYEELQKTVNACYLNCSINQGLSNLEVELIDSISNLCPLEFGNAVYMARSIREFYSGEIVNYADSCSFMEQNRSYNSIEQNKESIVKVYPNPSTGAFTFDFGEISVTSLEIYDAFGRLVFTKNNLQLESKWTISLENLVNGIYHYRLKADNVIETGKLILNKRE